jgi:hypothetical protein
MGAGVQRSLVTSHHPVSSLWNLCYSKKSNPTCCEGNSTRNPSVSLTPYNKLWPGELKGRRERRHIAVSSRTFIMMLQIFGLVVLASDDYFSS